MQTEFTCGIFRVTFNEAWRLVCNKHPIATIEENGGTLKLHTSIFLTEDDLIEIAVLMNNIKRQYKQLNDISPGQVSNG